MMLMLRFTSLILSLYFMFLTHQGSNGNWVGAAATGANGAYVQKQQELVHGVSEAATVKKGLEGRKVLVDHQIKLTASEGFEEDIKDQSNGGHSSQVVSGRTEKHAPIKSVRGPQHRLNDDQAQDNVKATDEVMNLMHKDYRGMNTPRRKPPINNHIPTD